MPYKDPDKQRAAERESKRRSRAGSLAKLAEEVAEIADLPEPPTRDELLKLLGVLARDGQVTAIKTLLEEQRRDASDGNEAPLAGVDELAARRARASGA